jgi:hypothetical protein
MLASLLPGVRDLRAPLAAGFLWLVLLWLVFEPVVAEVQGGAERTIWDSLATLRDEAGDIAFGAALTFAAYLLGALSEGVRALVGSWRARWAEGSVTTRREALDEAVAARDSTGMLVVFQDSGRPMRPSRTGARSIDRVAQSALDRLSQSEDGVAATDALMFVHPDFAQLQDYLGEGASPRLPPVVFLAGAILSEAEATRTRLQVKNADLFSKVDRLRSEAEFRAAVVPPLMLLGVAALGWAEAIGPRIVIGAGLLLGAVGLYFDSRQKWRTSDDALAEALAIEEVESPTMARLKALTEPGPERDRFQRWVRERS